MMSRKSFLSILGGVIGGLLITMPFVWLQLDFNYGVGTVSASWAMAKGLKLFQDLFPVLLLALAIWGVRALYVWARGTFPVVSAMGTDWFRKDRQNRWIGGLLVLLFSSGLYLPNNWLSVAIFVGLWMIQALGLNVAIGMTGLLVLGYAGFFSLGGYTLAVANRFFPFVTWWMALPLATVVGATAGWMVGLPCLRLRGDYLAIVTLGFGECFYELVRNWSDVTGGDKGLIITGQGVVHSLGPLSAMRVMFLVVLVAVILVVGLCHRLHQSWIGRAWIAIREDEVSAAAVGIPVVRMKLLAFVISAALGAVSGVLYVAYSGFMDPASGTFENSVMVLAMVILGGLGSIPGVLLGSALLYLIPTIMRDNLPGIADYRLFLFGIIMVLMMRLRPQGLLGSRRHQLEIKGEA